MMIAEGLVTVNGETETRKRRKIVSGDIVSFAGDKIRIQTPNSSEGTGRA